LKNTMRIEEIEGYLRDGGSIENVMIETDPSDHRQIWSKVGIEVDRERETAHDWDYKNFEERYKG